MVRGAAAPTAAEGGPFSATFGRLSFPNTPAAASFVYTTIVHAARGMKNDIFEPDVHTEIYARLFFLTL